jgi:hypothetical protein
MVAHVSEEPAAPSDPYSCKCGVDVYSCDWKTIFSHVLNHIRDTGFRQDWLSDLSRFLACQGVDVSGNSDDASQSSLDIQGGLPVNISDPHILSGVGGHSNLTRRNNGEHGHHTTC